MATGPEVLRSMHNFIDPWNATQYTGKSNVLLTAQILV